MKAYSKRCENCRKVPPVHMGYLCSTCVRVLAERQLVRNQRSSAGEPKKIAIELDGADVSTYRRLNGMKACGQTALRFMGSTFGIPVKQPVELPEYSASVFSDAITWEG